jgi:PDZ domain-containing secreted protein
MQRNWILLAAAVLTALPTVLLAQEPAPPPRVTRDRARAERDRARGFAYAVGENRGRIGVVVRTDASAETDKIGARVEGVTPGGPADKAGLKVGDVITKLNGKSLAGTPADDDEESGPGKALIAMAHKLEPGDTVQVEFRRGTESKKATLVAEELGSRFRIEMPEPGMMVMPRMPAMPGMPDMHFDFFESPWGDLRLVGLNSDLGEYFGTKEGVLVVKAPSDSTLPLRGGDVILTIGGRKPSNPEHAMRILRSYDKGETVSIEIMRKQKRLTVAWKVPAAEDRSFRRRPGREEHEDQSRMRHPQLQLHRLSHRQQV